MGAFQINNLRKSYGRRAVLDIKDASFAAGKITAVVGPNGCGKSTLLECLAGILKPDDGQILFNGAPLRDQRRRITIVYQTPTMFHGSVAYNVGYGLRLRGKYSVEAVSAALRAVRLEGFERRDAKHLSGGETKRVAIARALAIEPDALILDEPTANIDSENTTIIQDAVRAISATRGMTVILATHSKEQAVQLADSVYVIQNGALAPYYPDNSFRCVLTKKAGEMVLLINESIRIHVATHKSPGAISCAIPPDSIILSKAPFDSSARNVLRGVVTAVALEDDRVRVTVNVGVPIVAAISMQSHAQLNPTVGSSAFLTFKASAVKLF